MPSFIPVPNTIACHLRGTLNGEQVENTLYFHKAEAWSVVTMEAFSAALALWYRTAIVGQLSKEYMYRECMAADLTTADGLLTVDDTGAGLVGGNFSDASSNQAAFCVRFSTGRRGRSYRGRNYIPGIPEDAVSGGRISTALANLLTTSYDVLNGYDVLFGAQWVVVSRIADGVPRAYGISTQVVSASYSTLALASQRGRRPA
jgi:hypothetical protein